MSRLRFPAWTALACVLAALAATLPALGDAFIFDRIAIAHGQWWRLATGNLVHLSARHFAFDVPALLLLGSLAEQRRRHEIGAVYLLAAMGVGVAVYLGSPELRFFGGLSGLVTAALVLLALDGARRGAPARPWWLAVLALSAGKLALELGLGGSLLTATGDASFVPVPLAHVAGAAVAALVHFRSRLAPGHLFASGGGRRAA